MNRVSMIEYQGRVDENGKALGHGPKVLNEYFDFIKEYCNVTIYAPREILKEFNGANKGAVCKILPKRIVMGQDKTILKKLINKLNMFKNINLALKNSKDDTLWFFNVEFYFFLYIFLHKKQEKKLICTMFLDGYRGGIVAKIKQFIFEKAQKKIDLIIATGKQLEFKNCKYEYVPDYYFDESKFAQYNNLKKEKRAVCLGTMGKGKKIFEMLKSFSKTGYPLIIAGRFYDKELFKTIKEKATANIVVRDEYLSTDEYMKLLAESEYAVLPYGEDKYSHQTSGVMQEAIFLSAIPVSYKAVLDGNQIKGIGFETFDKLDLNKVTEEEKIFLRQSYLELIKNEYSFKAVGDFYRKIFG